MPSGHFGHDEWLARFEEHLNNERYAASTACSHMTAAKRFLSFLKSQNIDLMVAESDHVDRYLEQALSAYRQRYKKRTPGCRWRSSHVRPIQMMLRLAQGCWPRRAITADEVHSRDICEQYAQWMTDLRGFAQKTVLGRCREARNFLGWWKQRSGQADVTTLTVADVDQYMKDRTATLRRTGLKSVANALRSFLRWLHTSGQTERDLSAVLIGPSLYAFEGIPSALKWRDVERVLDTLRQDSTREGVRDYAIWMLLSRYGLRSREIRMLRLDDIDWNKEVIRIRHTKTATTSYLPLLPEVGEAILRYLEKCRPKVSYREIFIRHIAPRQPCKRIYQVVRRRLDAVGVVTSGRRGPHALRHARAVKLLSARMSLKQIGDVLGHQHSSSTMIYLKLATDELRRIALDIPKEAGA